MGTALLSKGKDKQGAHKDKECYNCKKMGHIAADCWAKGGGKEGKGPKGRKGTGKKNRANQAENVNSDLNDACYMAGNPRVGKSLNSTGYLTLAPHPISALYEKLLSIFILSKKR